MPDRLEGEKFRIGHPIDTPTEFLRETGRMFTLADMTRGTRLPKRVYTLADFGRPGLKWLQKKVG